MAKKTNPKVEDKKQQKSKVPQTNNKPEANKNREETINPEILNDLPPEVRDQVSLMISRSSYQGVMPNPLVEKLTPEHITQIIDASVADDNNNYKFITSNRIFKLIYTVICLAAFFLLLLFLIYRNP